ncbi:unnamed protein product [Diabrotica balteata]|uniref:Equilibrative nucleoside transporter 3 n=1 Tax=Diabrotica balteata TaxID=107213 RepID=A0A9N9X8B8_DIABA|nr:unnamed protein product [Diabrotica balteata]
MKKPGDFQEIASAEEKIKLNGHAEFAIAYKKNAMETDTFYLAHIVFLVFGIMHLLPVSFFVTANDYWMYKFRNTTSDNTDPNYRSILQSNFASGTNVAQSVPTVICMVLAVVFAYKIKVKIRILTSLYVLATCFVVSTVFIKSNTDGWQTGFFALTMAILAVMNGILALFQVSSLALLAKFPPIYMKTFLTGQGIGGIFCSALQVLALVIGTSSEAAALIYFLCGTILTTATLMLYHFIQQQGFYRSVTETGVDDTKKDLITLSEVKEISSKIWTSLVIVTAGALAYVPTHPSVAALVVSEYKTDFTKKYFAAVVTFLFSDICCLIGRGLATATNKRPRPSVLALLSVVRMVIFVPLFIFCNALPRKHLHVLFPHDWQYVLILGSFMISSGYFFNIAFLNVIKLAPEEEENAYLIMQTVIGITGAVFSPLGVLCVNLL